MCIGVAAGTRVEVCVISIGCLGIGVKGFEPSTSRSRTVRSSRAELYPDLVQRRYVFIPYLARFPTDRKGFKRPNGRRSGIAIHEMYRAVRERRLGG